MHYRKETVNTHELCLLAIADTLYIIFALDDLYYPGHPVDILYLFSYTFYVFGAYANIKLFGNLSKQK